MDPIISHFDQRFVLIDSRSRDLLAKLDEELLYQRPRQLANSMAPFSCGEYILRSAAMVEKTFGGITTRLWDDPFEWTLPEKLNNIARIVDYLDEVEVTRRKGFAFFTSDDDLNREIPSPEKLRPIAEILLDTIGTAEHFQGRAFAIFQMISDTPLPRV
jgi:hypothetical protein